MGEGPSKPALVSQAGPGSGKTRVVVARAHHLISAHGVPPPRILAITFTNKAAAELRERLAAVGGSGAAGGGAGGAAPQPGLGPSVLAKTFHGLGAYILRQSRGHASILGVDERFKILDADQSERLLRRVVEDVDAQQQPAEGAPASGLPLLTPGAARMLAERLVELVSSLKTQLAAGGNFDDAQALSAGAAAAAGVPPLARAQRRGAVEEDSKDAAPVSARWHRRQVQAYYSLYQRRLRENNSADFADLICLPVRLLTLRRAVRDAWRRRLDHLLVDEFQ
ncbi:ATP-dependent DNA helicase UvrD1, partial [Tetrabaena socialis]